MQFSTINSSIAEVFSKIPVRLKIFAGFAIAIAGISYFIITAYNDARDNMREFTSVNDHEQLISTIEKFLFDLQDMETGSRGFLITKDADYLQPYHAGLESVGYELSTIVEKIKHDPDKFHYVDSLHKLSDRQIDHVNKIVSLGMAGKYDEATMLIRTGTGKINMDRLRNIAANFENDLQKEINQTRVNREMISAETRKNFLLLSSMILLALIIFYLVIESDLTKSEKARVQNEFLARLIDLTSDAIFSTDRDLKVRSWNKGAERIYGFKAEEIINKNAELIRSDISKEERESILAEIAEKGEWSGELIHRRRDGSEVNILTSVKEIRSEDGAIDGYLMIVQDITARKFYENQLKNFNNELIEKVNIKTREIVNLLERVTDGFLSLDKEFRVTYLNNIAAEMLGIRKEEILGKDMRLAFSKEENAFRKAYMKSFEKQVRVEIEDYYEYLNKWFYCVAYPSPEGLSIFFRDVTKRKESEVKLVESEKQYRHLFEHNPLPMWVLDVESMTILDVNKAAIRHYGFSLVEFIGKNMLELVAEEDREKFMECCSKRDERTENAGVWKHITRDGTPIYVEILSYDTKYTEKPNLLIISNDITDKIRYEKELKTSRDQLRQLTVHSEKVREEERAHIAREIHDELGQQLTGLKMDLSWLLKKLDISLPGAKEKIAEMLHLVDDTVKSIRKIASELRPGMLDDLGLNAAIDWQAHEFQKRSGITCTYQSNIREQNFDKNISIGVFRILQEALTNVARHSNATKVNCDLSLTGTELTLTVQDNGRGIVMNEDKQKTLGIVGMKERALMMNGRLTIDGSSGLGTKVKLVVPLKSNLN